jgi:hypothetical protein
VGLEWYFFHRTELYWTHDWTSDRTCNWLLTGVDHNGVGLARKDWTAPGLGMAGLTGLTGLGLMGRTG